MSAFSYPRTPSALKKKWPTNGLHLCCINALCRHINSKTNETHANGQFVGHFFLSAPIGVYIPLESQKEIAYKQTTVSHCSQMHWCWKKSKKLACEPDSVDNVCLISVYGQVYPHSNCCPQLGSMGMSLFADPRLFCDSITSDRELPLARLERTVSWRYRVLSLNIWCLTELYCQLCQMYREVQRCFCPHMGFTALLFLGFARRGWAFIKCV